MLARVSLLARAACARRSVSTVSAFASLTDANAWSESQPHTVRNLLAGEWLAAGAEEEVEIVPDALNGGKFLRACGGWGGGGAECLVRALAPDLNCR